MMFPNTVDIQQFVEDFMKYVASRGISKRTLKNYKSDILHCWRWCIECDVLFPYLRKRDAIKYIESMVIENISERSINRRLTTLRHFSFFTKYSGLVQKDYMKGISNIRPEISEKQTKKGIIEQFEEYLRHLNITSKTIKNYRSDIKHFLKWLEEKQVDVGSINAGHMRRYYNEISCSKSPATVKRKISSLRKFLFWRQRYELIGDIALKLPNRKPVPMMLMLATILLLIVQVITSEKPTSPWPSAIASETGSEVALKELPEKKILVIMEKGEIELEAEEWMALYEIGDREFDIGECIK